MLRPMYRPLCPSIHFSPPHPCILHLCTGPPPTRPAPEDEEEDDGADQLLGVSGSQLMALLQHMGGLGGLGEQQRQQQPPGVASASGALDA